jgi:hypothetical protein
MRSMALVVCTAFVIGPGVALAQPPPSSRPAARQRTAGAGGIEGVAGGVVTGDAGGVYQPAAAQSVGELFEYRVAAVSIPHNESALVPIISTTATVERVSLWNGRTGARPLRALWFTNSSGLTLDGGSFSVIDESVFGGEGLIDAMQPGEKRLISYAVDLGVQVDSRQGDAARIMRRIAINRGTLTAQREERARRVYTIRNNDATDRAVVIEHPRRPGWTLVPGPSVAETSLTAYRFIVAVPAHHTDTLIVEEAQPIQTEFQLSLLSNDQIDVIVDDSGDLPEIRGALQEVAAAKARIARLSARAADRQAELGRLADDESRIRANMQSVGETRGSRTIVTRYTAQLTALDERIDAIRRTQADLARETGEAEAALAALVERLTIDAMRPN